MGIFPCLYAPLLLLVSLQSAVAEEVSAPSRWIGRVAEDRREFGWPGSGLEMVFRGTSLELSLEDSGNNSVMLDVDGHVSRLDLAKGSKLYVVADGLPNGQHSVRLTRRTEGLFGNTRFLSAETDGSFLQSRPSPRRLLVVGDSISAGYGVEAKIAGCKPDANAEAENQYLTYEAITGRTLGSDVTTLAKSGIGVSRADDDGEVMAGLIDRATPTDKNGSPSLSDPDYQAIIVNLGTNDFGSGLRPPTFVKDYAALLSKLRTEHPDALIYAALGPMLSDPDFAAGEAAVKAVVDSRIAAGDTRLHYLRLRVAVGSYGCNWHPSPPTHAAMAQILTDRLRKDLNWSAAP
ncbi:SGNH/GDSL hydrolase family protein [Rhizobium sp. BK376]|uniref:SGNH/GDSL hydrolase family protein n=1 Tax=Rhizobium sp. BK376 TaxID=2512149 RepID=UPI001042BB02|nr:SGNH/GDSL hydrolase family protein [Rhizobium sp. BK376]TCR92246.1 lysophospholipase L1-like esterase [Rhizobium sp. BK376]